MQHFVAKSAQFRVVIHAKNDRLRHLRLQLAVRADQRAIKIGLVGNFLLRAGPANVAKIAFLLLFRRVQMREFDR